MQDMGTLAEHFLELTGESLADGSWAQRRQRLPWDVFHGWEELLEALHLSKKRQAAVSRPY